jgi:predicted nucleic acid-binding protein
MKASLEFIDDGSRVFIDTNIFVYGSETSLRHYQACRNLLQRIANGSVSGLTTTAVLTEVFHAVSMMEVSKRFKTEDPRKFVKANPEVLKTLKNPFKALGLILSILGLEIVNESTEIVREAATLALDVGLLITDAKIAATCRAMGVGQIATNDRDFERVNLKVWVP